MSLRQSTRTHNTIFNLKSQISNLKSPLAPQSSLLAPAFVFPLSVKLKPQLTPETLQFPVFLTESTHLCHVHASSRTFDKLQFLAAQQLTSRATKHPVP